MAADRPLAEDDQVAGKDVGAFHGDADRQGLVAARHEVSRSHADAAAAQDVHGVVHHQAHAFGQVILDDRRGDRGILAASRAAAVKPRAAFMT